MSNCVGFSKYFARVAGTTLTQLYCVYTMCLQCAHRRNVNIYGFGIILVPFQNFCGRESSEMVLFHKKNGARFVKII